MLPLQPERPHSGASRDGVQKLLLLGTRGHPLLGVQRHRTGHVPAGGRHLHRHREQRGEQEPPVQQGHRAEREEDGQQRTGQLRQGVAHRLGDQGHIGGDPGGQISGTGPLHPLQRQPEGPFDELLAQPGQRGLAQPGDQRQAEPGGEALGDGDGHQQRRRGGDGVDGPAVGGQVHDPPQQRLGEQCDGGGSDHHGERGEGQPPLRTQQFGDGRTGAGGGRDGQQVAGLAHASTAVR